MGRQEFVRAACIAPVKLRTLQPPGRHTALPQGARPSRHGLRAFMNAASPGLITAFQPNSSYPSHDAYLGDLVDAMRPEYEAIVAAGFDLQLDCPDLAMSRHTGYQALDETSFLVRSRPTWRRSTPRPRKSRPRTRMHVCWGNYEGPHDHDIPLRTFFHRQCSSAARDDPVRGCQSAPRHEWIVWRDAEVPDDKALAPGLIDTCSDYSAPGTHRAENRTLSSRLSAPTGSLPAPIVVSELLQATARSIQSSRGKNSRR